MKNGWFQDKFGILTHYVNDKISNTKNISQIWRYGEKYWYQNNKWHRVDGPAREYFNRDKSWYYHGK